MRRRYRRRFSAFVSALITVLFLAQPLLAAPRDVQIRSVDFSSGVLELFNFGAEDESLAGWQFCSQDGSVTRRYSLIGGFTGVTIESGSSLFIHMNNDAPEADPDRFNRSQLGSFATLNREAFAISLYFPDGGFLSFDSSTDVADYLQWSLGAADNTTADERADEARDGGLWTDDNAWIATTAETTLIRLLDESGGLLHGPESYEVSAEAPAPPVRSVQIRSLDLTAEIVEIFNFAATDVALDGWSLCGSDEARSLEYTSEGGLIGVTLNAGASLFVHLKDDAPDAPDRLNLADIGGTLPTLDPGPYGLGLYFPGPEGFIDFDNGNLIADYLQWSVAGANDPIASERGDEASVGGVWSAPDAWVPTTADATFVQLTEAAAGSTLHGPGSYEQVTQQPGIQFHRGDTSGEGGLDLTDAVRIFGFLFLGGESPTCLETADANNDGVIELTDGVSLLNFLFQGGPPPAAPGPPSQPCGPDSDAPGSEADLGCAEYAGCG